MGGRSLQVAENGTFDRDTKTTSRHRVARSTEAQRTNEQREQRRGTDSNVHIRQLRVWIRRRPEPRLAVRKNNKIRSYYSGFVLLRAFV
jgi:hypothetical protein